ncbi:TPA: threonine synthase [Elizabethkingia anophelis]|uniref:Threonine synthase n=1 Tax=Elizabethkingia anophelis NUHP1 TaxID=1338011 RepID=A0A077EIM2_9FLAO|nr:threonine synthase [Elizabethkingia anophelis]AIL46034.1 Threonine synthase [Elizabethkingia anophelis NUHP1]MBE9394109.1 threonine synthase [Elizabethkingia anophelis]MBE9406230.1 threonine synthase [Elizabethkingia anophelis]MCT3673733.1 threonine synthase [Elizabethkingia anophelis]MCT3681232.1 threonine synthase [Elizabethkingia anophelis]
MKYYSTRGKHSVNIQQAVLNGLADDGGLYMPAYIPQLPASFFENIENKSLPEIGFEVAKLFLEDSVPDAVLKQMIDEVLNFDIPVVPIHNNIYSLELFHGPTLAFKDVGARFMARLMSYFAEGKPMKVIAATSGDTGSAVAAGFYNVPGINVYILYPKGKVSPLQEKQLTTWGGNIKALEIEGTFDDCQALAKELLADEELQQHQVTSANSINIARLIPQSFYYFWAYAQLKKENKKIVFSVPSGNFGNLTAGLLAYKMGLPVNRFIASTNINNVVPQYLKTGTYEAKASLSTVSNAMDVGNPSNFERMKDLFQEDVTKFREIISGYYFIDEETKATVQEVYKESGYLLDPHGAVAYLGLVQYQKEQQQDFNGVLLETAHPAKFIETVEESISEKIEIPEKLSAFGKKEKVATLFPVDFQLIKAFIKQY